MADLLTSRTARAFWRFYAAAYDRLWDNGLGEAVANHVLAVIPAGTPVLEVGAGTGLLTARLRSAGITVSATEPEPHMRARLQERMPDLAIDDRTLDQVCTDGFDGVVVLSNVLHLLADSGGSLERMRHAATAGVVVVTPSADASLTSVARALRAHGSTAAYVARFRMLHGVLAPLSTFSGATAAGLDDSWIVAASQSRTVGGVQRVATFGAITTPTEDLAAVS